MSKEKIDLSNVVFLLGGHDLEMKEIEKILLANKITFHDKGLAWGAKLSAYQDVFDDVHHFVAVELSEDCVPPRHYTVVDHHNERSHLPASIEQVAEHLGIELSHFQKLVAANDKAFIPGMIEAGASLDEIDEVRRLDRQAQGVTEEDERLAEISIGENLNQTNNLIIVESLTPRFSPITDRLYPFDKLLISHQNQLVYYGQGAAGLAKHYETLIKKHQAFSGGGAHGFFGIAPGIFSQEEFNQIKTDIINQTQSL